MCPVDDLAGTQLESAQQRLQIMWRTTPRHSIVDTGDQCRVAAPEDQRSPDHNIEQVQWI